LIQSSKGPPLIHLIEKPALILITALNQGDLYLT